MRKLLVAVGVLVGLTGCGERSDVAPTHPGEQIYLGSCFSCHASGVGGAPRVGSAEDWQPRLAKGREALLQATVEGIPPAMPAMGLCSDCSEAELDLAIDYMLEKSLPAAD